MEVFFKLLSRGMMDSYKNWHPNFPPNLENCHEEPIRIPGAIQTFGILIAFDANGIIQAISENAPQLVPEFEKFESKKLEVSRFLKIEEMSHLGSDGEQEGKRLVHILLNGSSNRYFGNLYHVGGLSVLEIETSLARPTDLTTAYLADMPRMMKEIRRHQDIKSLAEATAIKLKELTGFDRVMIYQFDREWNGEVIAESKESHLETFLGLHFPSSDIPPQARALYERNWIRIIPTLDYKPARILPVQHQSLDLSDSVLRSVSPIHVRYLKNMGVNASMSISLIVDGKLWGLVACHHYSEHLVPLNVRFGCESYGQLVSWHIKTLEAAEKSEVIREGERGLHLILQHFSEMTDFKQAALDFKKELLKLFDCSGLIIRLGSDIVKLGEDPGDEFLASVAKTLVNRNILEPMATDEASKSLELSTGASDTAAGYMALPLSSKHNYYIVCVRPAVQKVVTWAGNPHKNLGMDFSNPSERLIPRGSFELWKEMHQGKSLPWSPESLDLLKRFALLFVKIVIERREDSEKTSNELKALNNAKDEFVAMVSHELRTPLNAIIGWTELALSGELGTGDHPEALKIIQRNARSQNQLINDLLDVSRIISGKMKISVKNMRVTDVVSAVILSFSPAAEAKGIKIISHLDENSDSVIGDPGRIQQVVWNVLSNAMKFSPKASKIWISVRRVNSHVLLEIRDEGIGIEKEDIENIFGKFTQVDSSISRRTGGLGLGLAISKHIVELHGGSILAKSDGKGKGTTVQVSFPIAPVMPGELVGGLPIDDDFSPTNTGSAVKSSRLKGEVILIVEDERDASRFLDLLISGHGATTFVAHNGAEALEILDQHCDTIGIVLSDVGMPEMDGFAMVREIRNSPNKKINSVCTVALTAFGRPLDRINALRAGFDSYIAKPVMQEELLTVLESACKAKKRQS